MNPIEKLLIKVKIEMKAKLLYGCYMFRSFFDSTSLTDNISYIAFSFKNSFLRTEVKSLLSLGNKKINKKG